MRKKLLRCLAGLVSCCLLAACHATSNKENEKKPLVYTSFFPIYDLVKQVAGDTLDVRSFMPANVDPHMWEPTAKNMKDLSHADILFVNGANMEHWVDKVKHNLPNLKVVTLSDKIRLITYRGAAAMGDFQYMTKINISADEVYKFEFGHTHEDIMRVCFVKKKPEQSLKDAIAAAKKTMDQKGKLTPQESEIAVRENTVYALEMGHVSGRVYFKVPESGEWYVVSDRISERLLPYTLQTKSKKLLEKEDVLTSSTSGQDKITYDPHSWLSLNNAKFYLNYIYDVLQNAYPDNKTLYGKRRFQAIDKLTDIQAHYAEKFKALEHKEFLVTHYAWEYLAREYGLQQYPLQGLISTESPSLKTIRKAINYCKEKKINTIFYETNQPPKEAKTLAAEIGNGKFVDLTSMEYVQPGKKNETGAYTRIMAQNLHKLYVALGGKENESDKN